MLAPVPPSSLRAAVHLAQCPVSAQLTRMQLEDLASRSWYLCTGSVQWPAICDSRTAWPRTNIIITLRLPCMSWLRISLVAFWIPTNPWCPQHPLTKRFPAPAFMDDLRVPYCPMCVSATSIFWRWTHTSKMMLQERQRRQPGSQACLSSADAKQNSLVLCTCRRTYR